MGALLVAAVFLTVARNHDYRSEVALWERTALLSPDKPRVHNNLGYAWQLAGEPEKAARAYGEALRLDPDFPKARGNLEACRAMGSWSMTQRRSDGDDRP